MTNNLDKFEQLIKNSFDGYEVPYNSNHWDELESELNSGTAGSSFHYFSSVATGVVITFVIIASIFLLMPGDSDSHRGQIATTEIQPDSAVVSEGMGENTAISLSVQDTASNSVDLAEADSEEPQPAEISATAKTSKKSAGNNSPVAITAAKKEVNTKSTTLKSGCVGLTVEFSSDGQAKDANFLWNFGDGYFSSSPNPVHTYTRPGQFDVSLSVTSKSSGQISSNVVQGSIIIVEAPVANFRPDILDASKLRLINLSSNADNIKWLVNSKTADKDQLIDLSTDNTFDILLIADNENGCTDSLFQTVAVKNIGVQTASGGSFMPEFPTSAEPTIFKVFDETGKNVIYESNSKTLPWIYDKRQQLNNPWVLVSKQSETGGIQIFTGKVTSK